jgi:hypothetical protein
VNGKVPKKGVFQQPKYENTFRKALYWRDYGAPLAPPSYPREDQPVEYSKSFPSRVYYIICRTKSQGERAMECFPRENLVRPTALFRRERSEDASNSSIWAPVSTTSLVILPAKVLEPWRLSQRKMRCVHVIRIEATATRSSTYISTARRQLRSTAIQPIVGGRQLKRFRTAMRCG